MANGGRIDFTIGYKVDKTGLNDMKKQLEDISKMSATQIKMDNPSLSMKEAISAMQKVRIAVDEIKPALDKSFDTTTGIVNLEKLRNSLQRLNLSEIQNRFNAIGPKGQQAFSNISKAVLTTNVNLRQTSSLVDKMGQTLINTLKWSLSSSVINQFSGAIQQAYGYVQHLDSSLNDIRIVTDKSADEMDRFAEKANKAAKALGASTTEYTEAALIYYQQGLSDEETQARAETTLKAANVTGQTGREVSEQLTAVWNGYKVSAEETELYVDKLAAVAATTASDLEELSTGMSKVASAANAMGVDVDQLNGMLSTIISVTRQAPETAGTALKTIFARIEDLKISGEDEDGVKLGEVSSTLDEVGVHIMDVNGDIRDLGEVIEEVAGKWDTWTDAQQTAIAQAMAGKRQYNNLLALFNNWDMYSDAVETSRNSMGTLQKQQDIYMDSTEAHLQQLKTEWEDLYDSILDTNTINTVLDSLTKVLDKITDIIDALGGGRTLITGLLALITTKFSKQIAQAFSPLVTNMQNAQKNAKILQNLLNNINTQKNTGAIGGNAAKVMTETQQEMSKYWDLMSQEQFNESQGIIREIGEWENKKEVIAATNLELQEYIKNSNISKTTKSIFQSEDVGLFGSSSNLQATKYLEENLLPDIELIQNRFEVLNTHVQGFSEHLMELRDAGKALSDTDNPFQNMDAALNNAIRDVEVLQGLNEQGLLGKNGDAIVQKAVNTLEKLKNKMEEVKAEIGEVPTTSFTKNMSKDLKDISNSLDPVNTKIKEYANNLKTGTAATKEADAAEQVLQDKLDIGNLSIQKRTQAISQLVGSVSSLVFSMQAITNIGAILNDDDINAFEAIKQITTSLLISLPMLVSSYSQASSALAALTLEQEIFTSQLEAENAGLMGNLVALAMHKLGLEYDTKASAKNNLTTLLNAAGQKVSTTALGANTSALWENVAAWLGLDAAAAPVLAVLAAIAAVIAAVGVAIAVGVSMYNDHIEALKRDADAQQELSKELKETTDAMQAQKEAADELINKYNDLKTSSGDFRTQLRNLLIEYGYLTEANRALTDSYEALDEMMKQIQITANQGVIDAANTQLQQDKVTIASQIWAKGKDDNERAFDMVSGKRAIDLGDWEDTNEIQDILDKYNIEILSSGKISLEDFANAIVDNYDELFADLSASDAESAQQLLDYITNYIDAEMSSGIKETQSNKYSAQERNIQLNTDWKSKIQDSESYNQAVNDYATQLAGEDASEEEFNKAIEKAKQYFNTISDLAVQLNSFEQQLEGTGYKVAGAAGGLFKEEDIDKFIKVKDKMQEAIDQNYGGDAEAFFSDLEQGFAIGFDNLDAEFEDGINLITKYGEDYKEIFGEEFDWKNLFNLNPEDTAEINTVTQEQLDNLYNLISQYDPTGKISSYFTEEDWTELLGLAKDGNTDVLSSCIQDKLTNAYNTALKGFQASAGNMENNLQSIIEESFNGDVDTSEEGLYSTMLSDMETLKDFYPELSAEVEVFNNKALVGTEQWIQACYSLQEALSKIELKRLSEEANDLFEQFKETELHFDINSEEYENALNELLDKNYEIDVEIHADAEDAFENFSSSLDNIDDMVEKIDEGFNVSAEDVRELNNAFPGILEGMEVLADGTVQLNKDIAQSAIDSAQAEEDASFKTLVSQLEDQKTLLKAKQKQYQIIADAYADLAEDETLTDEARGKVDAALNELQQLNNKSTTDYVTDNNELIATNSNSNAEITAANWTHAWQEVSNASYIAAQDAIVNQQAIEEKDPNLLQNSTFGSNYKGNNGTSSEAQQTSDLQKTLDSDATNAAKSAAAQAMADAAGKAANDIDGMIAEATAKYKSSASANKNAGIKKEDSSSSTSAKEAQHEDYLEREVDLYREVNEQLEQIESTLGRIQKQNSYKWGKDLQKGLERENKLLDQQLDKLKQKAEIQKGDLAQRRANLEAQGIQFSKDGSSMKNAEATLDKMYAQYNSMVDTYNAMSADQQEEYKKQLEDKKKDIDKMENDLKNYESLFGEYQSILDELQELHYKQIENAVERFNNMVDVHLELDDAKKEWNDFWYEVVQDVDDTDFGGKIAQSIGKLQTLVGLGGKASKSQIGELTDHLNQTTEEAIKQMDSRKRGGEDSMFENATKLTKENLEKYRDQLMSAVREAKEEVDNIGENYIKQLESAQDLLDKQVEGWESIGDHIEHNIELIKLVSGEKAFDPIIKQYDKLYTNNVNLLNTQKQSQDFWKGEIDRFTKLLAVTEKGSVQWKTYSDSMEYAVQQYRKAVADLDKTVEKALKDLQEWRKTQDDAIFDQLEKSLTQGKGLEYVEDEWDLITEKSSKYLDNVERALEIEMYSNDLEKAANATGLSAKNQEKLNKFREEELKKLREKEKLTQYDIDESRARLAIMQAEMALEDQRANKSKMRLRRDSQGNYNYQYVGDESAEEEAENGLLSAKKEWYELVKKRHDELVNYEIRNIKRLQEFNQKANEALANHDMETYNLYKGLMDQVSAEMEQNSIEANKNLQDLTSGTAQFFSDVANANILPTSKTTADAITKDASGVKDAVKQAVTDMVNTQDEYDRRTTKILKTAGDTYNGLVKDGIDPTTDSLEGLVSSNETLAGQLTEVNSQLDEQQRLLAEAEQGYRNLRDAAVEAITDAEAALERLSQTTIDANQKVQASIVAANAAAQAAASASPGGIGGGADSNQGVNGATTDNSLKLVPAGAGGSASGQSYGGLFSIKQGDKVIETGTIKDLQKKYKGKVPGLKTGGYTGDWSGSDGKLAFLHQKELVLNESDTSNLLKVITMLRDVVASMNFGGLADSLVSSTAQWMNTMSARSFSNGGISNISNVTNDTNNYKSMVVNADFSGVRSADAIYQALVELENYGMQQNYSTAPHASKSY